MQHLTMKFPHLLYSSYEYCSSYSKVRSGVFFFRAIQCFTTAQTSVVQCSIAVHTSNATLNNVLFKLGHS
jgi:hypothetical protein